MSGVTEPVRRASFTTVASDGTDLTAAMAASARAVSMNPSRLSEDPGLLGSVSVTLTGESTVIV